MKRIIALVLIIFSLTLLSLGCSRDPGHKKSTPPVQPTQQGAQPQSSKPSSAEVDAQTDKVQAEIDSLLSDLENDSDELNLAKEKI